MNPIRGHFATSTPEAAPPLLAVAAGLAVAVLSVSSCTPEVNCEDIGCGPGLVCDKSSGNCVERETDCPESPCEEGLFCHRPTGKCLTRSRSCSTDADCIGDRQCNDEGVCELADKCTEEDCTAVETCDPDSGDCVPKECTEQSDCPLKGFICSNDGKCLGGCLVGEGTCPTGQSCREVSDRGTIDDKPIGECRSQCQTDAECPCGAACSESSNTCGEPASCDDDGDCRADEICRDGKCTCAPCTSDEADCPGDQVCDRPTGVCLGGDCTDDDLSKETTNHTPANSAELEIGNDYELTLCPGRSDWYEIAVASGQAVELKLIHDVTRDLDLVVYDDRNRVVASDQLAPPRQHTAIGRFATRTTVISQREQDLQIRVYSTRRRESTSDDALRLPEGANYELHVERADGASCTSDEDDNEENDTRQTAAPLPSNVGTESKFDLQICDGDLDWFVLPDVPERVQLQTRLVDVARTDDHLRFIVLSESGAHFSLKPSQALNLLRTGPEQDWFMFVYSRTRQSASYGIRYKIDQPYDCRGSDQHGTVEDALALPPQVETEDFLCPLPEAWEVDWIELDAPRSTAQLRMRLDPVPPEALPPLDVTLFEKTASGLKRLRPAARDDSRYQIAAEVEPSQDLFIRIGRRELANGTTPAPEILEIAPKYRIFYEYTMP